MSDDVVKWVQIIGSIFKLVPEVIEVVKAWTGNVEDTGDPVYAQCKAILDDSVDQLAARKRELGG
jgi:hypothetical protein